MRKSLLLAAAAAVVLAGCSQDDVVNSGVDQNNGTPIEFRTVTNKTRATESTDGNNIGDFRVSANKVGTYVNPAFSFMQDIAVLKTGASWSYAPLKFFPNDGTVIEFFAYSPSGSVNVSTAMTSESASVNSVQKSKLSYTVPVLGETKKAEDFLVSVAIGSKDNVDQKIQMNFTHALSMATFAAKNISKGMTLIVDTIEISDLGVTADLTLDAASAATTKFAWTTPANQSSTYGVALPTDGVPVLPESADDKGFKTLLPTNEGLMILPQTVSASTVFTVRYRAVDADNITIGRESAEFQLLGQTFELGKKYTFNITFEGTFKPLVFDGIDVEPWVDGGTIAPTPPAQP